MTRPGRAAGGLGRHQPGPGRTRGPARDAHRPASHRPYTFVADKGYRSKDLETELNSSGVVLLRPARPQRGPTSRRRLPVSFATEDRIRIRYPQGPARPRAPRWVHPQRSRHARHPANAGPDGRHPTHDTTGNPALRFLPPTTTNYSWNQSSSSGHQDEELSH